MPAALALYGQRMTPHPNYIYDDSQEHLKACIQRREELSQALGNEKRRLKQARTETVTESIKIVIGFLKQEINRLDQEIEENIERSEHLKKNTKILRSIPGIGALLAAKFAGFLPELWQKNMSPGSLTALVGIAPYDRDSGQKKGRRFIRGGRKIPRDALYIAILTGRHKIPYLNECYERLIKQNKPKKVAIVACMRRLLLLIQKLIKQERSFIHQKNSK